MGDADIFEDVCVSKTEPSPDVLPKESPQARTRSPPAFALVFEVLGFSPLARGVWFEKSLSLVPARHPKSACSRVSCRFVCSMLFLFFYFGSSLPTLETRSKS